MTKGRQSLRSNYVKAWRSSGLKSVSRTFQDKALSNLRFGILVLEGVVLLVSRKKGWNLLCHNVSRPPPFKSKLNPMRN